MSKKLNAHIAVKSLLRSGCKQAVVSPGSRNAPIITELQDAGIQLFSVVDERCAAFFALGLSISSKLPVALTCTSGTALLNYSPAIAEAYYQGVPLVVLSADRPEDRIDTGEGQSIRQKNVFANFQKGFLQLTENCTEEDILSSEKLLKLALESKSGPVHLNLPFREPLYEKGTLHVPALNNDHASFEKRNESIEGITSLIDAWNDCSSRLIICGMLDSDPELRTLLQRLNQGNSAVVLFETTSNLGTECGIGSIDRFIAGLDNTFSPDLVITLGEHIISKRVKQLVKEAQPRYHFHVNEGGVPQDTFSVLTSTIPHKPNRVLTSILNDGDLSQTEFSKISHLSWQGTRPIHEKFVAAAEYSDLKVFDSITRSLPNEYHLEAGNSSVIRYLQLFEITNWRSSHANRGTSGIDGSTSTAIGFAVNQEEPVLLISGDISFFYDSNALWNNYIPPSFRIIVINNAGGGIFRYIPGPSTVQDFETLFETNHAMNAEHLAKMYGFEYSSSSNLTELNQVLPHFYKKSERPKILEIHTPSEISAQVLNRYFSSFKS